MGAAAIFLASLLNQCVVELAFLWAACRQQTWACRLQAEEAARVQQNYHEHVDFLRHQIDRKQANVALQQYQEQQVHLLCMLGLLICCMII